MASLNSRCLDPPCCAYSARWWPGAARPVPHARFRAPGRRWAARRPRQALGDADGADGACRCAGGAGAALGKRRRTGACKPARAWARPTFAPQPPGAPS